MRKTDKPLNAFQKKLKQLFDEYALMSVLSDFFNSEVSGNPIWNSDELNEFFIILNNNCIKQEFAANYGGEGKGEDYWSVYKFTDVNSGEVQYIKFDGWYQSYNGTEFDEWFFVEPKEKLITVYE